MEWTKDTNVWYTTKKVYGEILKKNRNYDIFNNTDYKCFNWIFNT